MRGGLDFLLDDGLQTAATAEVDEEVFDVGTRGVKADAGGALLAGEVGLDFLRSTVESREIARGGGLQSGGPADLLQRLREEFLLPIGRGFFQEGEELALLGRGGSDLRQGDHGVAADFLLGVLQEGLQPLTGFVFLRGRAGFGENDADRADDADERDAVARTGLVEFRDFVAPKFLAREHAHLLVMFLRREAIFGCHTNEPRMH